MFVNTHTYIYTHVCICAYDSPTNLWRFCGHFTWNGRYNQYFMIPSGNPTW